MPGVPSDDPAARGARRAALLRRAELLESACAQVDAAVALRDDGPAQRGAWEATTKQFHEALTLMYPESFWAEIKRLAEQDPRGVDHALEFLEADPWCFRSGYAKERIAELLPRQTLDADRRARLEEVLVHLVKIGDRREFRRFCKVARGFPGGPLVQSLRRGLVGTNAGIARRSLLMLSEIPGEALAAHELACAQQVLLAAAKRRAPSDARWPGSNDSWPESDYWFRPRWITVLVRRYWDAEWGHELVAHAIAGGVYREPAVSLLASAPALILRSEEHAHLTELLLSAIDTGADPFKFSYLARRLDTPELRTALDERRSNKDRAIAMLAWVTLKDVRGDHEPFPDEWLTGD